MFNFWKTQTSSTTPESHRETIRALREKQLQKWEAEMANAPIPPKAEESDEYRPQYKNLYPAPTHGQNQPSRIVTMSSLNRGRKIKG